MLEALVKELPLEAEIGKVPEVGLSELVVKAVPLVIEARLKVETLLLLLLLLLLLVVAMADDGVGSATAVDMFWGLKFVITDAADVPEPLLLLLEDP